MRLSRIGSGRPEQTPQSQSMRAMEISSMCMGTSELPVFTQYCSFVSGHALGDIGCQRSFCMVMYDQHSNSGLDFPRPSKPCRFFSPK